MFDAIIDSGVFHVFDDANRARYVATFPSHETPLRRQGHGEVVDGLTADGLLLEVGRHPGRDG